MKQTNEAPTVTMARKGDGRREIPLSEVEVPAVYRLAESLMLSDDLREQSQGEAIRKLHNLANDLLAEIKAIHGVPL